MESNHHKQIQSLPHYHYTNPQLKLFFSSRFWRTSFYSCRINSNRSTTFCFSTMCFPIVWCSIWHILLKMERVVRIELTLPVWKTGALPLSYTRKWRRRRVLPPQWLLDHGSLANCCRNLTIYVTSINLLTNSDFFKRRYYQSSVPLSSGVVLKWRMMSVLPGPPFFRRT